MVPVEFLRRLRAVGRHRGTRGGADAEREDRNRFGAEARGGGLEIAFARLAVAHQQHRPMAAVALVLEHLSRRRQRGADVGGGIGEIVGARGIEKEAERGAVGGERKLEEGAAAEHDESHPIAGRRRHRLPRRRPRGREPARRHIVHRHRAREVEHQQHVPTRAGQLRVALTQLGARQGQQPEGQGRDLQPAAPCARPRIPQARATGEHVRLAERLELGLALPAAAEHRPRRERHRRQGHDEHPRPGEAHRAPRLMAGSGAG